MKSVYYIERRRRNENGSRMWRPVSWKLTDKEIADKECLDLNKEDVVFEYIVTEKPE